MIFLIVIGVILLILFAILFIPVRVDLSFVDDFKFKVSFLKITLFKSGKTQPEKTDNPSKEKTVKESENNFKKYFAKLKENEGFGGAVKRIASLVLDILSHIKRFLRHIKIDSVKLNITVGSFDAAKTALDYGTVCQAVYPITAFLDSVVKIGFKEININSDFENGNCDFMFSLAVKMQVFFLILTAVRIYSDYKKIITENIENERKQH